jgi:hypothetical protein
MLIPFLLLQIDADEGAAASGTRVQERALEQRARSVA